MSALTDTMKVVPWNRLNSTEKDLVLRRPVLDNTGQSEIVQQIIRRVRDGGDTALAALTREFDGVSPKALEVGAKRRRKSVESLNPALARAILDASQRIEAFHRADRPADNAVKTAPGLRCDVRYQPLSPVETSGALPPGM